MQNNFAEATRLKLRVSTNQGQLSVEDLWDLSLTKLSVVIKNIKKQLKGSEGDDELSFLDETKSVDKVAQLTFDVLKEIYLTKKSELDASKQEAEKKAVNEKIMALIYEKENEELKNKSLDELKAMLQ
jgi:hypothetical protein